MVDQKPKVLFVDDEPALLDGIRRGLKSYAAVWDMNFITSPGEALAAAKTNLYDVVVTDLRMPGLTGLELLTQLRQAGCQSQTIILTGTGDMAQAIQAINTIGVFRFYTKPCPALSLAAGIEDALAEAANRMKEKNFAKAALDILPLAALAVDTACKVLFANVKGGELLVLKEPVSLDNSGICRALTPNETQALHGAIASIARGGTAEVLALSGLDERRFSVLIEPPPKPDPETAAILFVRLIDSQTAPSVATLRQLFGLSPSEARLAHELAKGFDVKEAAETLGVTVNTARTYLRTIFQKTGVNRQSELIRLFNNAIPGQ